MPFYHKLGKIPHKRHTTFKKKDGGLHYEELFGTIGFDGMSSLLYHLHRPTQVKGIKEAYSVSPKAVIDKNLKSYLLKGFDVLPISDHLKIKIRSQTAIKGTIKISKKVANVGFEWSNINQIWDY